MQQKAVGSYLESLRQGRGLSHDDVAIVVGVSGRQVKRWEQGESVPSSQHLALLLDLLRGSPVDTQALYTNRKSTIQDGLRLAEERLRQFPGKVEIQSGHKFHPAH